MEGLIFSNYKQTHKKEEINSEEERSQNERIEKHLQDRKRKIYQVISKKRLLQNQSNQNTIQKYFSPEVQMDIPENIQKVEAIEEDPGKKTVTLQGTSKSTVQKFVAFIVESWDT